MVIISRIATITSNPPTVPTTADVTIDIDVGVVGRLRSVVVVDVVPLPLISVDFVVGLVGVICFTAMCKEYTFVKCGRRARREKPTSTMCVSVHNHVLIFKCMGYGWYVYSILNNPLIQHDIVHVCICVCHCGYNIFTTLCCTISETVGRAQIDACITYWSIMLFYYMEAQYLVGYILQPSSTSILHHILKV